MIKRMCVGAALGGGSIYAIAAFAKLDFAILSWDEGSRAVIAMFAVFGAFVGLVITAIKEEGDGK